MNEDIAILAQYAYAEAEQTMSQGDWDTWLAANAIGQNLEIAAQEGALACQLQLLAEQADNAGLHIACDLWEEAAYMIGGIA